MRSNSKNLILPNFNNLNRTVSGVTFTHNNDGKFHAKGTATSTIEFAIVGSSRKKIASLKAGTEVIISNTSDKCVFMFSNTAGGSTLVFCNSHKQWNNH